MIIDDLAKIIELPLTHKVYKEITIENLLTTLIEQKTLKDSSIKLGIGRSTLTNICKALFPDKESKETWSQYLFSLLNLKRCSKCSEIKSLKDFADSTDKGKHIMCIPCLSQYGKERYYTDKEQHLLWNKSWRANNPDIVKAHSAKRRAIKANAVADGANISVIKAIYEDCFDGYHVDHIIPLSRGGKHHQDNLCWLPATKNLEKHNKMPEEVPEIMKHAIYPNLEAY